MPVAAPNSSRSNLHDKRSTREVEHPRGGQPASAFPLGPVVQRWVSANPRLKFNPLF